MAVSNFDFTTIWRETLHIKKSIREICYAQKGEEILDVKKGRKSKGKEKNRISKQVFFSLRPMSVLTHLTNPPPHPLSLYGILHLKGRKFTTINEVLINK